MQSYPMASYCYPWITGNVGMILFVSIDLNSVFATDWTDQTTAQQQAELVAECAKGRYLNRGEPKDIVLPNWTGFETKKYTYPASNGQLVSVVLLDASPERCADWVGNAVTDVLGKYDPALAKRLAEYIVSQSGFHFPVAGLVDEQHGHVFAFRDGIAVRLKNLPTPVGWLYLKPGFTIDGKLREYAISAPRSDITSAGAQARPSSIAVEEFRDGRKPPDPEKPSIPWNPDDIRAAYQQAWRSNRNSLITNFFKVYSDGIFPRADK
jgi:hypothetical protein